jgi:hypothetical protein
MEDFDRKLGETDGYLELMLSQMAKLKECSDAAVTEEARTRCERVLAGATEMAESVKHAIVLLQIAKNTAAPPEGGDGGVKVFRASSAEVHQRKIRRSLSPDATENPASSPISQNEVGTTHISSLTKSCKIVLGEQSILVDTLIDNKKNLRRWYGKVCCILSPLRGIGFVVDFLRYASETSETE